MTNSFTITATRQRAGKLIKRLDACVPVVHSESIKAQILIYAGFLSDMEQGRLDAGDVHNLTNLNLITEFCDAVEKEYPQLAA
jgi:hypothetical protein